MAVLVGVFRVVFHSRVSSQSSDIRRDISGTANFHLRTQSHTRKTPYPPFLRRIHGMVYQGNQNQPKIRTNPRLRVVCYQ